MLEHLQSYQIIGNVGGPEVPVGIDLDDKTLEVFVFGRNEETQIFVAIQDFSRPDHWAFMPIVDYNNYIQGTEKYLSVVKSKDELVYLKLEPILGMWYDFYWISQENRYFELVGTNPGNKVTTKEEKDPEQTKQKWVFIRV